MRQLKLCGEAPKNAHVPNVLQTAKLFRLNVDDEIWEDIGLDEEDGPLPRWLGDEDVHKAIPAMLDHQRATEELARLTQEEKLLLGWVSEETSALKAARQDAEGELMICYAILFDCG